ncbi:MAG: YgjV family protein [Oscillospiraceae bacterium]|nr:YgjV family protein [Oscillospiraceae bacterium]
MGEQWSVMFIISQVFVLAAMIAFVFAALSKQKKNILFYRIPFMVLYGVSFALQGLWVAFGMIMFGVVTMTVYYIFESKGKAPNIYVLISFLATVIAINVFLWQGTLDLFPMGASLVGTWAFWQKNERTLRFSILIPTTIMIIYNIFVLNYMGVAIEVFIQCLQVMAFVRYDVLKKESLIKDIQKNNRSPLSEGE